MANDPSLIIDQHFLLEENQLELDARSHYPSMVTQLKSMQVLQVLHSSADGKFQTPNIWERA